MPVFAAGSPSRVAEATQANAVGDEAAALGAAVKRLLNGERDAEALCAGLRFDAAMIIETTLEALADPTRLKALLPDEP